MNIYTLKPLQVKQIYNKQW